MNLKMYVYFIGRFVIGGSTEFLSIFQNGYSFSTYPKLPKGDFQYNPSTEFLAIY